MAAVKEHLVSPAGALLLAPAYDRPVREIGYITRYAAGMRENGGVYTHAATWAISAAGKSKDPELFERLLAAIDPTRKDPDAYWAEPHTVPSPSGTRALFASDWGGGASVDTYVIELPSYAP